LRTTAIANIYNNAHVIKTNCRIANFNNPVRLCVSRPMLGCRFCFLIDFKPRSRWQNFERADVTRHSKTTSTFQSGVLVNHLETYILNPPCWSLCRGWHHWPPHHLNSKRSIFRGLDQVTSPLVFPNKKKKQNKEKVHQELSGHDRAVMERSSFPPFSTMLLVIHFHAIDRSHSASFCWTN